jgi:hypothetical protein
VRLGAALLSYADEISFARGIAMLELERQSPEAREDLRTQCQLGRVLELRFDGRSGPRFSTASLPDVGSDPKLKTLWADVFDAVDAVPHDSVVIRLVIPAAHRRELAAFSHVERPT